MVLAVLVITGEVVGQQDNRNAASWYQRAIDQYHHAFTNEQRDAIVDYLSNPGAPPTPQVRELITQAQPILSMMRRGSTQQYCDFDLNRDAGFEMLLPHLSPMRQMAKLMSADAQIHLADRDASGAATRIADMYRMSGQFGDDKVLISSLVGQAVFGLSERTLQAGVDAGAFGPADSAVVLSAVNALSKSDPFQYIEGLAGEQELAVAYLTEKFVDSDDRTLPQELFELNDDDPRAKAFMALDAQGFQAEIDKYDQFMNEVVEAFAIADPALATAKINELVERVENGEVGVLGQALMPAFGKCLESKLKGEKMLAERVAMLQRMAKGEVTIEDTANAAVWYLRGIDLMDRMPPDKVQAVRECAADPSVNINDELAATLHSASEAIDCFRQGSMIKRCDFSRARPSDKLSFAPPYVAGMHDALRLAQGRSVQLLRAGDKPQAAEMLAMCLRMCGHLGGDPVLTSSLVAHLDFSRTMALIRQALDSTSIDGEGRTVMAGSLDRVSRRDPFGYIGAVVESRRLLTLRFTHVNSRDEDQRARWMAAAEEIKAWNAEQLLHYEVIADTLARNSGAPAVDAAKPDGVTAPSPADLPSSPIDDPLIRLGDVLNLSRIEVARADTARIAPMLAQDDWELFARQSALPPLALPDGIMNRMRTARADLRRAMMLLNPASPGAAATTEPSTDDPH